MEHRQSDKCKFEFFMYRTMSERRFYLSTLMNIHLLSLKY